MICFKMVTLAAVLRIDYRRAGVERKRPVRNLLQNSKKDMMKPENKVGTAEMVKCGHIDTVCWIYQQNFLMDWIQGQEKEDIRMT